MTVYRVVTTFSKKGYEVYGKRCIESFLQFWPKDVVMHVYLEHQDPPFQSDRVVWHQLSDDADHEKFVSDHGSDPIKVGTDADFNGQSIRFCHKTFAVTDPALQVGCDWLIWLDADVETFAPISHADLATTCPDGFSLAFLGRDPRLNANFIIDKKWRPICSETGWVSYKVSDPRVRSVLNDMRSYYTTGEIFTRPSTDWHDAKCFDLARLRSAIANHEQFSFSRGLAGTDVWPRTILAKWTRHHKGPGRKTRAYGRSV